MTPPPGWYPDPAAPATERWWDGSAWTEHRRTPPPPNPPTTPMGFGPAVPVPAQGKGTGTGRRRTLLATVVALVVVAAAVGTGIAVLGGGDDQDAGGPTSAPPTTGSSTESPSGPPSPSPADPSDDPSVVVDDLNGITLPVLDGWTKAEYVVDDTIVLTTPGTYDCPGDGNLCHHGTVASSTITNSSVKDPKTAARKDISEAANHAFDRDEAKQRPYNGLVSHHKIKEGTVAVAGRAGYMVRWQVKTGAGPGGYVESLVFPSSIGSGSLVCVRFAFEAGDDGPPLSDMDRITKGIRPVDDAATDGGVGSTVGPSQ